MGLNHIGRKTIMTHYPVIDQSNILDVIQSAMPIFRENAADCQFLLDYEKGIQPLQRKTPKQFMKDIDFECVDGIPTEISDFWISFSYGTPICFVQRGDITNSNQETAQAIAELNNQYALTDSTRDLQRLGRFVTITGIAYSYVNINIEWEEGEAYFTRDIIDPRCAFVVRSNYYPDRRVMLAATFSMDENRNIYMTAWTKDYCFQIYGGAVSKPKKRNRNSDYWGTYNWEETSRSGEKNPLGRIPIVEWVRSDDRTGVFEKQISAIDALNLCLSDISNGIDQQVQAIWLATDLELPKVTYTDDEGNTVETTQGVKDGEWLFAFSSQDGKTPKVSPLTLDYKLDEMRNNYLSQRTLILEKCHVPQRNDNSGSSSGLAVNSAVGWADAENIASALECLTIGCQREELRVILSAIRESYGISDIQMDSPLYNLKANDIDPCVRRPKNYELTVKTNALCALLAKGVSLEDALAAAPLVPDPAQFIARSGEGIRRYQEANVWKTETIEVEEEKRPFPDISDEIAMSPHVDGLSTGEDGKIEE